MELHLALFICVVCHVRGLGLSCTLKQNILFPILLIRLNSDSGAHESKEGHL